MFDVAWEVGSLMEVREGCRGVVRRGDLRGTISEG